MAAGRRDRLLMKSFKCMIVGTHALVGTTINLAKCPRGSLGANIFFSLSPHLIAPQRNHRTALDPFYYAALSSSRGQRRFSASVASPNHAPSLLSTYTDPRNRPNTSPLVQYIYILLVHNFRYIYVYILLLTPVAVYTAT